MNLITLCPCCSEPMLRHIGNHRTYWFCRHCWQEMPDLTAIIKSNSEHKNQLVNLSIGLKKLKKPISV